jgi:hypothetical protein
MILIPQKTDWKSPLTRRTHGCCHRFVDHLPLAVADDISTVAGQLPHYDILAVPRERSFDSRNITVWPAAR